MIQLLKVIFIGVIVGILLLTTWNIFVIHNFYLFNNLKSYSNTFHKDISSNDSQIPLFVKTVKNHTMFFKENIPKDTSFFFLETSGKSQLTLKEFCAIESAAKLHPKRKAFFLMTNKTYERSAVVEKMMETYSNIQFLSIDLTYVFKGTVIENLWLENKIQNSAHYNSHMSDILRSWFVYNYGGTYLDTDIIVLKELPLDYNYAGVENTESFLVTGSIIHFTHHHKLLKMILEDISKKFDGSDWINNGPAMFTNNIIKLCKGKTMKTINEAKCHNIQLFPPNAFFSVFYPSWQLFFNNDSREDVKNRLKDSLIAHYWGKLSSKTKIKPGMPIHDLALEKCPLTAKYFQ
ncbi:lactosylceramide 4-alpha-galactosyltransferase [Lepeophtheirus salmonis]|nr:lactosylceramide 4-alpha-galactosyltransferase-like [Lepeophtheirus salmonis]